MKALVIYILLAGLLMSCEENFKLDLKQTESKIVIEGLVTDNAKLQSVRITKTSDFYSVGASPKVTNAKVTVSDDAGNTINFIHNPRNHPDSAGTYIPEVSFAGQIGRTYSLKTEVDGKVYEATDKLVNVLPIDSLETEIDPREFKKPAKTGKYYEVLMFAREDQSVKNFYLFKFYRNDSLTYDNDTDIYFSDDEILAENINGVPAPIYYGKGDKARVEIYSLSNVGFMYYNDLVTLLNNDSGMFSPIPATPRTNMTNGALGFFQVSALSQEEIMIE